MKSSKLKISKIISLLPRHNNKKYKLRQLNKLDKIIIHHSASDYTTPKAVALYHVNDKGWPGIGYHFVIDKAGFIFQTNYIHTISYHCKGYNTESIGICLEGNFNNTKPTNQQLKGLVKLIYYLKKLYDIDKTYFHKELVNTACPGNNFKKQDLINNLRNYESTQNLFNDLEIIITSPLNK